MLAAVTKMLQDVSQGSAVTHLRSVGIFGDFATNLLESFMV